jgi:hypothetical protein
MQGVPSTLNERNNYGACGSRLDSRRALIPGQHKTSKFMIVPKHWSLVTKFPDNCLTHQHQIPTINRCTLSNAGVQGLSQPTVNVV